MTNNQVHEQLIAWLAAFLGVTVIKDRQQGKRPAFPYGMVDLANWRELSERPSGVAYKELETTNSEGLLEIQATPTIEIEWAFLFFVYGPQGPDLVRKLQAGVHFAQIQEPLFPDLVIHEISPANSLPELVNEVWEPRTQVTIIMRGVSSDGFVIDTIEEHDINVTGERA